jgi:anti-sigma regulatory factor (Ser/Thr protein kinase)/ActR/RegA family two-component response regulator
MSTARILTFSAARILLLGRQDALLSRLRDFQTPAEAGVECCDGESDALHRLRSGPVDVVVTDPETSVRADLAFAREIGQTRPGVRVIVLAPAASPDDVIAALRAHVFACYSPPFDYNEIAGMVSQALLQPAWEDGIHIVSGLSNWFTLRVSCRLLTAERLINFMTQLRSDLPDNERDLLIAAFREMLINAMEHGAGFDARKVVEVTAAKTARAIVYHFRDPGDGFSKELLPHVAKTPSMDEVEASAEERAARALRPGGFGMLIARQVADELVYNESGNEVILIKHIDKMPRY